MPRGTVLILEPESSGLDLVPTAIRLGHDVQVFDHRPLASLGQPVRDAVEAGTATYRTVDTRSAEATVAAAGELAGSAQLDAVVPGFEYAVPIAAAVAAALGLPGLSLKAAEALRNKDSMKAVLTEGGAPVARGAAFGLADGEEKLRSVFDTVGFPAVIKPVDGSGSLLVRRVDSESDVRDFLHLVRSGLPDSLGRPIGARLLLESYVDGPEFSIEGFVEDHRTTVVAATQKLLGAEPHFAEIGHIVDADLDAGSRAVLEKAAQAAVQALDMALGVFHLEVRLTAAGPVIMEIGARLAGDRIPMLVEDVHGYDMGEVLLRLHSGEDVGPPAARERGRTAFARFFTVGEESTLDDPDHLLTRVSELPGCLEVALTYPPGTTLQPVTDWRQRFGRAVFSAPDRDQLVQLLARVDGVVAELVRAVPQ